MAKLYKLTTRDGKTRPGEPNELQWGEGVAHNAFGNGGLCTDGVIHAYTSPLLAAAFNMIHAGYEDPILWECEGEVTHKDGEKVGCKRLTMTRRAELPSITTMQLVRWAILCAQVGLPARHTAWHSWAARWLSGKDRARAEAVVAAAEAAWEAAAGAAAAAREAARAAAVLADTLNLQALLEQAIQEENANVEP